MVTYVIEVNSENFETTINSNPLVLVDVWAAWCGPCKIIAPFIDQVSTEYSGKLTVCKLDADSNKDIVSNLGIRNIPTILIYKNGEIVETKTGVLNKKQLSDLINSHL
jgi:thioredoxin 1